MKIQAVDFTHQFISNKTCAISTIDHFVSNHQVLLATTEAGVLHHPENTSNHSPIFVKIDAGSLQVDVEQCTSSPRTSWTKATEEEKSRYKVTVPSKLSELQVPECISCTDLHCHDHFDAIADYTIEVLKSVEAAAKDSLPVSGGILGHTVPEHRRN